MNKAIVTSVFLVVAWSPSATAQSCIHGFQKLQVPDRIHSMQGCQAPRETSPKLSFLHSENGMGVYRIEGSSSTPGSPSELKPHVRYPFKVEALFVIPDKNERWPQLNFIVSAASAVLASLAAFFCLVAVIKPFGPFRSRRKAFLAFIGFTFLNGLIAIGSAGIQNSAPPTSVPSAPTTLSNAESAKPTKSAMSNWSYSTSTDQMTNDQSVIACTTSINELSFAFPYGGGSSGRLCFSGKGKALGAWVSISSGQFLCGIESCSLRLKFDEGSIQNFPASESATLKSDVLFIQGETRLLTMLRKSKSLKLEADYFQEGRQVLIFDVTGFDASRL